MSALRKTMEYLGLSDTDPHAARSVDAYGDEYDAAYDNNVRNLGAVLDVAARGDDSKRFVEEARLARDAWVRAHTRMNATLAGGDFNGASVVAIGPGDEDSTEQFDTLDGAMQQGIADTRNTLRSDLSRAATDLDLLSPGALFLAFVAAVAAVAGLWPRLREYR